jgi:hypothetical protein
MKKLLLLSMISFSSLFYSQKEVFTFDLIYDFPDPGVLGYVYEKNNSDDYDYRVIAGSDMKKDPIKLKLEVDNKKAVLYMNISNADNPKRELNFRKVAFTFGKKVLEYEYSSFGTEGKSNYIGIIVDSKLMDMLMDAIELDKPIDYELTGKVPGKSQISLEELYNIKKMFIIIRVLATPRSK